MADGAVRTAVVGLGYFGAFHARHHAASPAGRLVAVVDADPARAAAAAAEHGVAGLTDHRALTGMVDAVSVTAPTPLHHRIAGDLLDAGIHVLVEKPVTDDPDTARDLVRRAARRGLVLQVGHVERFSAPFAALRRAVRRPAAIDALRHAPWKGRAVDVDVVLDLMIHDIDLVLALAGAPVTAVAASGMALAGALADTAEARLTFANGVVARLSASRVAARPERRLTVTEPGRILVADFAERRVEVLERGGAPGAYAELPVAPVDALGAEIAAFLASVATGAPVAVDGAAGLAALTVARRIAAEIARTDNQQLVQQPVQQLVET